VLLKSDLDVHQTRLSLDLKYKTRVEVE
jgi:hypothetical protein